MDRTFADGQLSYAGAFARYQSRRARIIGVALTGVWLIYLISGVAYLFRHHYSAPYIAGGLAIIVVFCVLYLILVPSWPAPRRYTLPGLAALALLATAACVFYGQTGLVALWIFMSSASGLLVQNRSWAVRAVAGCIACYVLFGVTTHIGSGNFLGNLLPVVIIGFAMIGLRSRVELTAELARARGEVVQLAASEERLRLARDMHDLTGQSLSMITLKSELAARLLGRLPESTDRDRVRDEIEQVAAGSRQTLRDIREAISGYRRPTLAVEVITARAALASAGIAARDDADLTLLSGTFDPDAEAALAWCLREAVTNVVRHSGAENCYISLSRRPGTMSLTVRDDGTSHLPSDGRGTQPLPAGSAQHSSGLRGMSERLSAVGGSLEVRPDLHPGFCLIATVSTAPVPAAAPPADTEAVPAKILDSR
jgi:two-component system, NarL family, sensor histidine kinase DesK